MQQWLNRNLDAILVGVLIAIIVGVLGATWKLFVARFRYSSSLPAPPDEVVAPPGRSSLPPGRSHEPASSAVETIATLSRLQQIRTGGEGFIVITDAAAPPRLHRSGCAAIREEYFLEKVVENEMRNGKYCWVASKDIAERVWPRLAKHTCV